MLIAVDFDGTCVSHDFPRVGPSLPGAVDTLQALAKAGHLLILWTCREDHPTNINKRYLKDAADWFATNGIPLVGINETPKELEFRDEGTLRKVYADVYIDDRNLGGFPGWDVVGKMILEESADEEA